MADVKHVPDIMEVIADLSNDEVRTPPRVANQVLDLLPEEVWSNPDYRWLDPGTKSGVFLREATKRLMIGLADKIPDEEKRLEHILTNQMFGIAPTELSALMARRALYCSRFPSGVESVVKMPSDQGFIWRDHVTHPFVKGRCPECSASVEKFGSIVGENHAYGFIHQNGRAKIQERFELKFDVIVGNPPYQMTGGGGGSNDTPIYNLFVEQAIALGPKYVAMITPSRWFAGGRGLDSFRARMLSDRRLRVLVDFPRAADLFPQVGIEGGVSYFLWDSGHQGQCEVSIVRDGESSGPIFRNLDEFDVFVRDPRSIEILRKVQAHSEPRFTAIYTADTPFGIASNFTGYSDSKKEGHILLVANDKGKRKDVYLSRSEISKNSHLIDKWKVLIPEARGVSQTLPDLVIGFPMVVAPPSACTQTYLFAFVETEKAAKSIESYVRTRFFRFLVSLRKISQHAYKSTYEWVPQQAWDKTWTDIELFEKYKISPEEQLFIEEMIKEMPAS